MIVDVRIDIDINPGNILNQTYSTPIHITNRAMITDLYNLRMLSKPSPKCDLFSKQTNIKVKQRNTNNYCLQCTISVAAAMAGAEH